MVKCNVILNHNPKQGGGGARCHAPSFWPGNMVLKPNFQSIISQTNNGCSLLSLILAKLLLLDISCENAFALSIVTILTTCPFSMKKCAKINVFVCEFFFLSILKWMLNAKFIVFQKRKIIIFQKREIII